MKQHTSSKRCLLLRMYVLVSLQIILTVTELPQFWKRNSQSQKISPLKANGLTRRENLPTSSLPSYKLSLERAQCRFPAPIKLYLFSIPEYPRHSPSCSSILSHSSRMKCLICLRLRLLLRAKARMRPGVPTTIWGQFFFRTSSSFLMDRPPKNTATYGREEWRNVVWHCC